MASPNWNDVVYDGALDIIKTAIRVDVCTTEPTSHTEATSTYTVGNYTVDSSDFTNANGDTSGRKSTLGAQSGNNGTGTGAANFIAFTRTSPSNLLLGVIDGDGDTVNSGSPFTIAATDVVEFRDAIDE